MCRLRGRPRSPRGTAKSGGNLTRRLVGIVAFNEGTPHVAIVQLTSLKVVAKYQSKKMSKKEPHFLSN